MGVLTTGYLMVNSWTDWRRKEVDMVCWKEEQDRKKQRKNGKQSVVKVDFRGKVSQVRLQEIRRKYG